LIANIIQKLKSRPSLAETIQVMMGFTGNLAQTDIKKAQAIVQEADRYIQGEAKNGYRPYETEYCADNMREVLEDIYPQEFEDGSALEPEQEEQEPEIEVTPEMQGDQKSDKHHPAISRYLLAL